MNKIAVDKACAATEQSCPGSDESCIAANPNNVSVYLKARERAAGIRTASLLLPVCLFGLVVVAAAAAIGYGRYTTACYAQLVSSVDRDTLLSVIRMGYQ